MRGRALARSLRRNRGLLDDQDFTRELLRVLRRNGIMAPIRGASQNLIAGINSQTANVALGVAAANLFPTSGNPLVLNTPQYAPSPVPWALAVCQVQEITGVGAAATCTIAISQVVNGVMTQVGGGISVNQAAGVGPIDTAIYLGLISGAATEIIATGILSSSTGTVTNSATLPSILAALSFL